MQSRLKKIILFISLIYLCIILYFLVIYIRDSIRTKSRINKTRQDITKLISQNKGRSLDLKIPRKIIQTVPDKANISPLFQKNIDYIKRLNPTWQHTLFDNAECKEYIQTHFPEYLPYYLAINPKYGAARADFFRYVYMYVEGGVYLDIKSAMKYPLDEIIYPSDEFILTHWYGFDIIGRPFENIKKYGEFQQWHIICKQNHPALLEVIQRVIGKIQDYKKETVGVGKTAVLHTTGPVPYTEAILSVLHKYKFRILHSSRDAGLLYNNISENHERVFGKTHYKNVSEPVIFVDKLPIVGSGSMTRKREKNVLKYCKNIIEFTPTEVILKSREKTAKINGNIMNIDNWFELVQAHWNPDFDCVVLNDSDDLVKMLKSRIGNSVLQTSKTLYITTEDQNTHHDISKILKDIGFTQSFPSETFKEGKILYTKVLRPDPES
jgi:inositol phosphorylceramide mannosyltransferase catalytic subunit